ncbi:MAG: hypothetical protein R3B45_12900 [Bdellovibrionota bacterium]
MEYNRITNIQTVHLDSLISINSLNFRGNNIEWIEDGAFKNAYVLDYLWLHSNPIKEISLSKTGLSVYTEVGGVAVVD